VLYNEHNMKEKNSKIHHSVWLVGGETAGHIMPLLAVAEELKHRHPQIRLTYIGDGQGREATLARQAGIHFVSIQNGKLRRYLTFGSILLNIRDSLLVLIGIVQSYRLIKSKKPDLIFSKGGPVALPVALAAAATHTPLITHESDVVMGISNRLIANFASTVLTSFPAAFYPTRFAHKIKWVGLPLRPEFCESRHTTHHGKPMVLITGGSQGAMAINEMIASILPDLLQSASVMHIVGPQSYKEFKAIKDGLPDEIADNYGVLDFTPDIAEYMREATVVVTRASSTIFELATLEKPMILIPLPSAANNHQLQNAELFVRYNAAILLNQENLTPSLLYETINSLLHDPKLRTELKKGTRKFNCCDSSAQVANLIVDIITQ
jgi:UDP-N-acetylglucosamine--N-acetylmuramyl-(pentapeptide) pyrophosphoryl-undecaprenol N-acetylglucosamine transferase